MNRTLKAVIVAAALILVGAVLAGCGLFAMDGAWDLFAGSGKLITTQETITGEFTNIDIDILWADLELLPSPDGTCYYKATTYDNMFCSYTVENGTLRISQDDSRKWHQHIGIYWGETSLQVYLPEDVYGQLTIQSDTSDVTIPANFTFENASITTSTGDMDLSCKINGHLNLGCSTGNIVIQSTSALADTSMNALNITTSTGNVRIRDLSANSISVCTNTGVCTVTGVAVQQNLAVSTSTGDIQLMAVTCSSLSTQTNTGDGKMNNVVVSGDAKLESSTGDWEFDRFDAANITIDTDTGDVEGTLLSDKIFFVTTDTGDVVVPRTTSGGRCEITTDTGDIEIEIAQ